MLIGALEAGGTKMVCSIGTPQGNVLQRASFHTLTPEDTIPQIADFFEKFEISALGVGSFGPLDLNPRSSTYGHITSSPKKAWRDFPIITRLKEAVGVPVAIDTDVNAAALAEHMMGAGKGYKSLVYVTVGTGIGGGLIVNGEIVHGLIHPEVGHMILTPTAMDSMPDGICIFHKHCLEGLASGPAIEKRWGLSPTLMMEDHPAWDLEAMYLAQMCANLILILSPEVIVLGGGVMQQEHLFPKIRKYTHELLGGYVASERLDEEHMEKYIVPPALGNNSGVIGALLLGARMIYNQRRRGMQ
ncbi:MAG: ROK family protein [Clostridia bacterium]|nr:ROK family protein [Clostridia bacterium]